MNQPAISTMRFVAPAAPSAGSLLLSREEGLALLDWLGLGRPEFGAIAARELSPRCRRRLWPIPRNARPELRARTMVLLALAEAAEKAARGSTPINFG